MYHYYNEENNKIYDNRYDALLDKIDNNQKVKMYWRDSEFDKVDWKKEPKENLPTLYKERAQQIRNDYDYVVLCYSGGIDSTNMMETFYYNNIFIDEVVSIGSFSQDDNPNSDLYMNKDIYKNVKETLNEFHIPNTKKTFIDYTKYFDNVNQFSMVATHGADYYKYIGAYPSVRHLFWYDLPKFLNLKKRSAIVFASEKPFMKTVLDPLQFYVTFSDAFIGAYTGYVFNDDFHKLNFYSDPEANSIARKQLHIIKNFYIENVLIKKTITNEFFNYNYFNIIHSLIYDLKNPLKHISRKSSSMFLSNADLFLPNHKSSDIYKVYTNMLQMVSKKVKLNKRYQIETKSYYLT